MTEAELLDILRQGLWTAFILSFPILASALVIGIVIGLLQALTSIQELTLTFVPKLGVVLAVFWISMGYAGQNIVQFYTEQIIPIIGAPNAFFP
jgi:flagellar biosynthetic protein FliQ